MEEKRKALIKFCIEQESCVDCPLGCEGHKCGAGYSFRCGVTDPGYITDAEVEEMYKIAFPERVDSKSIKISTDWCATCANRETCAIGEGFQDECDYNGTSIPPTLWEMDKTVKREEKYRNYCDSCARRKSGACNVCESGYDGVPTEYLFELAQKTQAEIRCEILDQAKVCVCTDRKGQYGDAEQSFRCIAELWNAYLKPVYPDICITPVQASMMMVLFKAARDAVANVHKIDTYVDMCGYAACAGGMIDV